METTTRKKSIKDKLILKIGIVLLFIVIALFISLVAYRLVTGKSLGLRSFVAYRIYRVKNLGMAIIDSSRVKSDADDFTNIVFVHHSTGNNLIKDGNVRKLFQEAGYELWDHGYNEQGLRMPDGKSTGYNYNIPGDNTNPGGLNRLLNQTEYPIPINAYSGLLQHDVLVLKSCFRPTNNIRSDEQLEQYKTWYLQMRDEMDQHSEKVFIIVSPPPLNPAETNPEEATRARAFSVWLQSDEFLSGHTNIYTFDYFNYLAVSDPASEEYNMLKEQYRVGDDSHPNQHANETIGPIFVEFISNSIGHYKDLDEDSGDR